MANILGVGIATLDIINTVSSYPAEDAEVRAESQRFCRGGNVTNTLTVLSQFENQCYWAGVLCKDYDAQYILDDLKSNDIDFTLCQTLPTGKMPTSYIISNTANGSRTIVHYRDLPELSFDEFKKIQLSRFDWIHFEGRAIDETRQMITWCKSQHPDIPVSIEVEKDREGLENIFSLADIYLFSKAFATLQGYDNPAIFLENERSKSPHADLVCAWGEEGAYALIGNTSIHANACPPEKLIDTLGAGDTFNAGIIQARLKKLKWHDALDFANQLAGKKCGQVGFEKLASN
ncbi:MAG: PfkB family carbohydrate kinase [Gammaproteobacteria bacterium]|nr:PfkB family carbohydrate kinase [Gammaproteobacteria bacterium]